MVQRKINVTRHVAEMERVLRVHESPARCEEVIALLKCWQHDEVLDAASREKAKMLVREFGWPPERRSPEARPAGSYFL